MPLEGRVHNRALTRLMVTYAVAALLLVAVSARLWGQSPLDLIAHEFDYFLGLFASPDSQWSGEWFATGKMVHFAGCLIVGVVYLALVAQLMRNPGWLTGRRVIVYSALVALIFAAGMPWVSPDVFFYIGKGWSESHYGVSPFLVPINHLPGYHNDQMFANIYPGFLGTATGYGPLFQKAAEVIAALSGGNEKLALALHKAVNIGLHGASSVLVYRLAPAPFARVAGFSYAVNPLICFSVLTCVHNDHWMNVFVLLSLLALARRRWLWVGVAMGAAFGVKYFPVMYMPILGLAALMQRHDGRGWKEGLVAASSLSFGFASTVAASFLLFYPEALSDFVGTLQSGGASVYRNSIYHLVNMMSAFVVPEFFGTRPFLLSYEYLKDMGTSLRAIYLIIYASTLLLLLPRLQRDTFNGVVEGCLIVTVVYFIVANPSNQEWYLTWLMGLALVLPYSDARYFAWRLSAFFLPLVIYTVRGGSIFIELISNSGLYLLVVALGCQYLWKARLRCSEAQASAGENALGTQELPK